MYYSSQVKEIASQHKEKKDEMSRAEFLSGFRKGDKLIPVITITVYWGTDAWDAPINLHDMLEDVDAELKGFIPNYHINLVAPYYMSELDFRKFQTSLGKIFKFLKYAKDKHKINEILKKELNTSIDNETVSMINLFADVKIRLEEKEETNMCQAIEELKQDYAEEKVNESKAIDCVTAVENIMKNLSLSLEEACRVLEYTVETYQNAKLLIAK